MTTEKLFETALRQGYRYPFRGLITTEDLWKVNLENLDDIYKALSKEMKEHETQDSLFNGAESDILVSYQNKIQIVTYIFETKNTEREARLKELENAQKKKNILSIIAKKNADTLEAKSVEELQKMLEDLDVKE